MNIKPINTPLAARLRPKSLNYYIGQKHLVGKDKPIRRLIELDDLVSMVFWGPPGCGKTTLAQIIAAETKSKFFQMSAVNSGKADIQKIIEKAKGNLRVQDSLFNNTDKNNDQKVKKTILFIDEIHRFSKVQQDFLLPFVEDGTITLIGATTENPSFEIISPLLSRCRVFILKQHTPKDIKKIVLRAIQDKDNGLGNLNLIIKNDALDYLAQASNGDPRTALNALELAVKLAEK